MTVKEFIDVAATMIVSTLAKKTKKTLRAAYATEHFKLPRIYCKDGFSFSAQVQWGTYSGSENGYQEFGIDWKGVEFGFPSTPVDKYPDCGMIYMEELDALVEEHGGIDIETTLKVFTS